MDLEIMWRSLVLTIVTFLQTTCVLAADRPNIVLIVADDLGYRELGCYGQQKIKTPNIDRLALQGMKFTRAYAGSPVCAPSRCVLMTGKHPGHAWIRDNGEVHPEGQHPIPATEVTVAEVLKEQGYVTGAFGKWGLGPPGSEGDPLKQGFDRFFGYNCQRQAHSYYPGYLWSNDKRVVLKNDPALTGHERFPKNANANDPASFARFKGQDYAPDHIVTQAMRFVRDHQNDRFFLYYATPLPHLALHVPDEDLEPYLAMGWKETPLVDGRYSPHMTPRAAYAAMISRMDRNVGALLRLLDELKLSENTIVVFTSDNGASLLTKEVDVRFFNSVGDLRGLKGSLYEGGVRVPMIVRWPGRIAAGSSTEQTVGFEDILPTCANLAGCPDPADTDGISFLPTLLGKRQPSRPLLYREFNGTDSLQSVYFDKWKAIRPTSNSVGKANPTIEIYDLSADPGEKRNLAADNELIVHRAKQLFDQQHTPSDQYPLKVVDRR